MFYNYCLTKMFCIFNIGFALERKTIEQIKTQIEINQPFDLIGPVQEVTVTFRPILADFLQRGFE